MSEVPLYTRNLDVCTRGEHFVRGIAGGVRDLGNPCRRKANLVLKILQGYLAPAEFLNLLITWQVLSLSVLNVAALRFSGSELLRTAQSITTLALAFLLAICL